MNPRLVTSGMTKDQINNIINQNFIDLQNQSVTQIIKDPDDGKRRIIFGKLPNGSYGLVISKKGYDVVEVLENEG